MTGTDHTMEHVVLVHGLARTTLMFRRLAAALRQAGFGVTCYRYPSTHQSAAASAASLRSYLERVANEAPSDTVLHLVGFSLGAVLVRAALDRPLSGIRPGRIVMLAPPNRGVGILAGGRGLARRVMGPAVADIREGAEWIEGLPIPDLEIGIIAGTKATPGLSPASWMHALNGTSKNEPHDGTVEVRNTRLDSMTDFATVHAGHTFFCSDPEVIRQTIHFLAHGRFDHVSAGGDSA